MRTALRTTALRTKGFCANHSANRFALTALCVETAWKLLSTTFFMDTALRTGSFTAAPMLSFVKFFCSELGWILTAAIAGFLRFFALLQLQPNAKKPTQ